MGAASPDSRYYLGIVILMVGIAVFLIFNFIPSRYFSDRPKEPTQIYFADNISPAHREIITRFNRNNAGEIEVVPIHLPFDRFTTNERKELLARSLRSQNSRIDIFSVDVIWVPRFARWALPLDFAMQSSSMENLLDVAMYTAEYDSVLVSVPFYIDIGVMYYRKDIIQSWPDGESLEQRIRNGITWGELRQFQKAYSPNRPLYLFQGDQYEGVVCQFVELIGSDGISYGNGNRLQLDTPEMVRSLRFLVDMIHEDRLIPTEVSLFREGSSYRYALKNDIPFFRGWPGLDQSIEEYGADSAKVKQLGIAPLPHPDGQSTAGTFGGWNLMISRHTSKREEAIKFLRYAISSESQELLINEGHYYPVNTEFYTRDIYKEKYPELQYYGYLLHSGIHRPRLKNYTEISEVLSYYLNKALKQQLTPEEALTTAAQTLDSKRVFIR